MRCENRFVSVKLVTEALICFKLLFVDSRWRRWPEERNTTTWNLCIRNSNVHGSEKQQEVEDTLWTIPTH